MMVEVGKQGSLPASIISVWHSLADVRTKIHLSHPIVGVSRMLGLSASRFKHGCVCVCVAVHRCNGWCILPDCIWCLLFSWIWSYPFGFVKLMIWLLGICFSPCMKKTKDVICFPHTCMYKTYLIRPLGSEATFIVKPVLSGHWDQRQTSYSQTCLIRSLWSNRNLTQSNLSY